MNLSAVLAWCSAGVCTGREVEQQRPVPRAHSKHEGAASVPSPIIATRACRLRAHARAQGRAAPRVRVSCRRRAPRRSSRSETSSPTQTLTRREVVGGGRQQGALAAAPHAGIDLQMGLHVHARDRYGLSPARAIRSVDVPRRQYFPAVDVASLGAPPSSGARAADAARHNTAWGSTLKLTASASSSSSILGARTEKLLRHQRAPYLGMASFVEDDLRRPSSRSWRRWTASRTRSTARSTRRALRTSCSAHGEERRAESTRSTPQRPRQRRPRRTSYLPEDQGAAGR